MTRPAAAPPVDRFVYRLLAAISAGTALLTGGFAANQAFQRIPNVQRFAQEHRIASVGRGGEHLFAFSHAPLAAAGVALLVSLAAMVWVRRSLLAAAFCCTFAAIGVTLASEIALSRVWTWVMTGLK